MGYKEVGAYPLAKGPLSEFGEPIFKVSFTHEGKRRVTLLAAAYAHRAKMIAQGYGWTQITVGKWRGHTPLRPTPWVTRASFAKSLPSKSPA
jgi:hypothetical protein